MLDGHPGEIGRKSPENYILFAFPLNRTNPQYTSVNKNFVMSADEKRSHFVVVNILAAQLCYFILVLYVNSTLLILCFV